MTANILRNVSHETFYNSYLYVDFSGTNKHIILFQMKHYKTIIVVLKSLLLFTDILHCFT